MSPIDPFVIGQNFIKIREYWSDWKWNSKVIHLVQLCAISVPISFLLLVTANDHDAWPWFYFAARHLLFVVFRTSGRKSAGSAAGVNDVSIAYRSPIASNFFWGAFLWHRFLVARPISRPFVIIRPEKERRKCRKLSIIRHQNGGGCPRSAPCPLIYHYNE
jgi:hypothetical protein